MIIASLINSVSENCLNKKEILRNEKIYRNIFDDGYYGSDISNSR
jgi:hypothetical protein